MSKSDTEQARQRLRQMWHAARRGTHDATQTIHDPDVLAQLAWIDARIRRSLQHAATSNRARGAVREWTQKRAALMRAATQTDDAGAHQAERLLLSGAPEHLRRAEARARYAVELQEAKVAAMRDAGTTEALDEARSALTLLHATHKAALQAAIDWEPDSKRAR